MEHILLIQERQDPKDAGVELGTDVLYFWYKNRNLAGNYQSPKLYCFQLIIILR